MKMPHWRGCARARSAAVVGVLAALPGCSTNYPNPFENSNQMVPPPATAKIAFSSNNYAATGGGGRDLFAMDENGATITRLTFCNTTDRRCDYVEPVPGPSRERIAVRRVVDTDGDGKITSADGESLRLVDLSRAVEGELVAGNARVSGADWSPGEEVLYYSANATTGNDDLFQITSNGQNNQNLTSTTGARERRPRFNGGGTALVFDHVEPNTRGQLWIATSLGLRALDPGGTQGDALPNTPYYVGSSSDGVFAPDGRTVAFRRLVGLGNGGLGAWDIMTIDTQTTGAVATTLVTGGNAFRGAPDWGPLGLVYVETLPGAGPQIVLLDPATGARKILASAGVGFDLSYPHWFK